MAKKNKKKQQTGQQFLSPEQFMKQRARSLEIGTCYISEDMTECGEGHVIVTRRHTGGRISAAIYLVDTYCIGVKDSFFRPEVRSKKCRGETVLFHILVIMHYFSQRLFKFA